MKFGLFFSLFLTYFFLSCSEKVFSQNFDSMNLLFKIPKGFFLDSSTKFDKGPALGGVKYRLVSLDNDILIAITLLQHDTTERGVQDLEFIRNTFNSRHDRNQNYYSYVRMLADSTNFPIKRMNLDDLKYYNCDYGALFTIKDEKNPYYLEFPYNNAKTMFKWKSGDVFVWYFFRKKISSRKIKKVIKRTKNVVTYN